MGLSATDIGVAQQHISSYPLQRAYRPLTGKACCATPICVAPVVRPPSRHVTVLRHCRCSDCLNFSRAGGEYFCSEYIGGTAAVWTTGERSCDPPSDEWHYCARYHGPQVSKDVWVWPKATPRAAQVGAGANISPPRYPTTQPRHNRHEGQTSRKWFLPRDVH